MRLIQWHTATSCLMSWTGQVTHLDTVLSEADSTFEEEVVLKKEDYSSHRDQRSRLYEQRQVCHFGIVYD